MASVLEGPDHAEQRPTRHRREEPRKRGGIRRSAATAVAAGLAITVPLMLRGHENGQLVLAPSESAPAAPDGAGSTGSTGKAPSPASSADPTTADSSHTGDTVSRDANRSATTGLPSGPPSQSSALPSRAPSAAGNGAPTVQVSSDQATAYEAQVVTLTNAQRTAHGCPALRDDSRLRAAAIGHSVDMRVRDYFAHNTPDGVTPWTRVQAQGYANPSAENIAMGQQTPQAVVDAWMNSPGHRANILNCSSKAIGVGVQFGPGGPWWTQDFGYS